MAPPFGLVIFGSAPVSANQAPTTEAKASLISIAPISSRRSPALSSAFWVAGIGPVSIMIGSTPAMTPVWKRTSGVSPSSAAFSLVITNSAADPSEICEALPAVTTPPSTKGVGNPANFSTEDPGRIPWSAVTPATSTISSAKSPSAVALAARSWDSTAISSRYVRDRFHFSAIISADTPWLTSLPS